MSIRLKRRWPAYAATLALTACAAPPEPPQQTAAKLFTDRTNLVWPDRYDWAARTGISISGFTLTADGAAQLALINNPTLAAQLSEMGVSQADYQMAAEIPNPDFYIAVRPPDRRPAGSRAVDIEATAAEDVLGILLLPLKKKIAAGQMRESAVRSADAALQLVHDVRVAVDEFQRVQEQLTFDQQYADAAAAAADFAARMHSAGNVTELELAEHNADAAQAKMDVLDTQAELADRRETINRLIGARDGAPTNWTIGNLPILPKADPAVGDAIASAKRDRLDLQLSQLDIATAEQNAKLAGLTILPHVNVGVDMERTTNKQTVVGPSVGFEVPIFNQHQGEIAKAKAELRQAEQRRDAMAIDIETELRSTAARKQAARQQAELATGTLVPQREAATAAMQRQYNGMLVGLYQLLLSKQAEIAAHRSATKAVARYWIAEADWDRAIGR